MAVGVDVEAGAPRRTGDHVYSYATIRMLKLSYLNLSLTLFLDTVANLTKGLRSPSPRVFVTCPHKSRGLARDSE